MPSASPQRYGISRVRDETYPDNVGMIDFPRETFYIPSAPPTYSLCPEKPCAPFEQNEIIPSSGQYGIDEHPPPNYEDSTDIENWGIEVY